MLKNWQNDLLTALTMLGVGIEGVGIEGVGLEMT